MSRWCEAGERCSQHRICAEQCRGEHCRLRELQAAQPSQSAGWEERGVAEEVSGVKVVQDLIRLVQGFVLVHRRETSRSRKMTWEVIALV